MPYDPVFKELLKAFFREFLELFYPEVAARLDFARVRFLDKEVFTDFPQGSLREPDLLAETYTLEGQPELILIHIEVQAKRDRAFPFRMFEYFALLRLRMKLPVFPLVLYIAGGVGGITHETYIEQLFGEDILQFQYGAIGLPDLNADDYLERSNPFASSLAALMKPSKQGKARQKLESFLHIVESSADDARKVLLAHVIESYLKLTATEQEQYKTFSAALPRDEVKAMVTIFEARGKEIGFAEGVLETKRADAAKLLKARFGVEGQKASEALQNVTDIEELNRIFDTALTVSSLEEVRLPQTDHNISNANE